MIYDWQFSRRRRPQICRLKSEIENRMLRFVILLHETPPDSDRTTHWDLMLDTGDALRTWALSQEPRIGAPISAEVLPDHRSEYLDYEGPVSRGRGTVTRWDAGHYSIEQETAAYLHLRLDGARLQCQAKLRRNESNPALWRLELTE
jgi:hypothetical protein